MSTIGASAPTEPPKPMAIDTQSEEVLKLRQLSLELLLSDHRADCEAPCSIVCPKGLDVEHLLWLYDAGRLAEARSFLAATFPLDQLGCADCKAPFDASPNAPVIVRNLAVIPADTANATAFTANTKLNAAGER